MLNILYLNTHDIGCYLEPYGYQVETPNLMELAKEGLIFRNTFCACPTCSPSRGALVTGQYPHSNGLIGLTHRGFTISDHSHHLASYLSGLGYETVLSGVQHEGLLRRETELGYRKVLNPEEYYRKDKKQSELLTWQDEMAARNAVSYLKERDADSKPFFMAVGFGCTHRDYPEVPDDYDTAYVLPPKTIPDTPESRRDMAGLMIALKTVDRLCGTILKALKETGEYDNTLILFTTDHGVAFPKAKCNLNDDGSKVSLLMTWPGMKRRRSAVDALISQVDLFPTLCTIAGLPIPDWIQGKSFLPVIEGEKEEIRDAIFSEINYHVAYEPVRSVRTKRYRYVRHWECGYPHPMAVHIDDGESKEIFHRCGYFETTVPEEELYDLMLDPQEGNNLAGRPEYAEVLEDMRKRMEEWQIETGDPLLDGKVSLPEGAIACTPDSYSTKTQVILPECRQYLKNLKNVLQNAIEEKENVL